KSKNTISSRINLAYHNFCNMADSSLLFDDLFTITTVDKDGKKFDRVSRLNATSTNHSMNLVLDFNVELYPLKVGDSFALALSSSLTPEGEKDSGLETQTWRLEEGKGGLADEYEYVMGFRFGDCVHLIRGLLMALTGDYRHLDRLTVGQMVFLLMRR
ncbi:hypothetical protein PSTT_08398, partial [Puccinia striiformis]